MRTETEALAVTAPVNSYERAGELNYRPDIDGLRAIAVILVVAYHIGFSWAKAGFIGVDVFFVISGYLIGSMVYRDVRVGSFSILNFYRRRAKRILPALFAVLAFCYIAATLLLSPHETKVFAAEAIASLTSSSNIFYVWFTAGYFSPDTKLNPLLMTWSLGVEEQFYLLFPLLVLLFRKMSWRIQLTFFTSLALLSLAAYVFGITRYPAFTFFLLPTRAWELGTGVLLGIFEANRTSIPRSAPPFIRHGLGIVGLALIGAALLYPDHNSAFSGVAVLLSVGGASSLIGARRSLINRLLSFKPMRAIGLISYSWYLWHWPLLSFARIACVQDLRIPVATFIGIASLALAVASFKFVEQPFRRSATPATPLLKRYASLTLAMMALPVALLASHGLPERSRRAEDLDMAAANLGADKCMIQSPATHLRLAAQCGFTGAGPALALVGDSHAAALTSALREAATQSNYRLLEFTKGFCTPIGAPPDKPQIGQECAIFNRELEDYVEKDPSVRAVFLAGYWRSLFLPPSHCSTSQPASETQGMPLADRERYILLSHQIQSLIARLVKDGKIVYLVQDSPHFDFDPMRTMRTDVIEPRRALARLLGDDSFSSFSGAAPDCSSPGDSEARQLISDAAEWHSEVRLVDLHSTLCSAYLCRFTSGDQIFFIDNNHLSLLGARIGLSGLELPDMASFNNRSDGARPSQ